MVEKEYDAMVIMGRCVAKDNKGKWRPAPYLIKGRQGRINSGIFESFIDPYYINPDSENSENNEVALVAGGNANTLAGFHLFQRLKNEEKTPNLIIFAAGRPPYLAEKEPYLCEGDVMQEAFLRKADAANMLLSVPEIMIFRDNVNSRDDMEQTLKISQAKVFKRVAIITVGVHVERSQEFLNLAREKSGISEGEIETEFIPSEDILMQVGNRYKRIFDSYRTSQPYKNMDYFEQRGIRRLKDGTYFK